MIRAGIKRFKARFRLRVQRARSRATFAKRRSCSARFQNTAPAANRLLERLALFAALPRVLAPLRSGSPFSPLLTLASPVLQCRSYPWWPRILASKDTWEAEGATSCEGISPTAPLVPSSTISRDADEWAAWLRRFPDSAVQAAASTRAWCDKFVAGLELCPWARSSIDCRGAVRMTVITTDGYDELHDAVRTCAQSLADSEPINPNLAISFVVAPNLKGTCSDFVAFAEDVDDELGSELDVVIAGFHPTWLYGGSDESDSVNFEKRSPHPTISVVLGSAVDAAGEEATERIGLHNEKKLREVGKEALAKLFKTL